MPAAPPGGDQGPPVEANPLAAQLRRCVVRIDGDGTFRGTGFFVAPGEVLTCAHVVHGRRDLVVEWSGGPVPATRTAALPDLEASDDAAGFYPLPDVALLRLGETVDHPCVAFDLADTRADLSEGLLRLRGTLAAETPGAPP